MFLLGLALALAYSLIRSTCWVVRSSYSLRIGFWSVMGEAVAVVAARANDVPIRDWKRMVIGSFSVLTVDVL